MHFLLPILLSVTPAAAADDSALIGKVVQQICLPFAASRNFPKALAGAKAQGFTGLPSGDHADLKLTGSEHRLTIAIDKDEFGETLTCKLLLAGAAMDPVSASVRKAMGGAAPQIVPNLSPKYPPSHQWIGKASTVSVATLGGTAPVVIDVYPTVT